MRDIPILDPRTPADVIDKIRELARSYAPEWRFDPTDMDAGAALAILFQRMFSGTIDRYNEVLHKDYIEFLNLLGVKQNAITPATGHAAIQIAEGAEEPILIDRDTQLYYEGEEGERIYYMTDEPILATPANLISMISVDPESDGIAVTWEERDHLDLFKVDKEDNQQLHRFAISHDSVLNLAYPCEILVDPHHSIQFLKQTAVDRLADPGFALWEYYDGESYRAFDTIVGDGGEVRLVKGSHLPMRGEEEGPLGGAPTIRCTMTQGEDRSILAVEGVRLRSRLLPGTTAGCDAIYSNDLYVDDQNGGYCFTENMVMYDCLYLAAGQIFDKAGATITLSFDMRTVVRKSNEEQARYDFRNRMIIDKDDTLPEPPQKYVSKVVWEYFNGFGWTHLPVTGDINPFSGESEGMKRLTFHCPEDIASSLVGATQNHWIRARVIQVENPFDLYATVLLPFLNNLTLHYEYPAPRQVQGIFTSNNLTEKWALDRGDSDIAITLFEPMADTHPGIYLCFDQSPHGYPLNLYFDFIGRVEGRRQLNFEIFTGRRFEPVKVLSHIDGGTRSGVVSIYAPDILAPHECFGQNGFFIRLMDTGSGLTRHGYPRLRRIVKNAVPITQRQVAPDLFFSTTIYNAGKEIRLDMLPLLDAQVWVDELNVLSATARDAMMEADVDGVRVEYGEDQRQTRFWVRWNRVNALSLMPPDARAYEAEASTGILRFGDGVHGRVVPTGDDNIWVHYSYGGGAVGNLPTGSLNGIITTRPSVAGVTNLTPLSGGNDLQPIELVERIGPHRLRHRNRAVTARDYESLVLEAFSEVRAVKCFPNRDRQGRYLAGAVTVVVLCNGYRDEVHSIDMCQRIYAYLFERCDGIVARGDRLGVIPAQVMTVNVTATIELDQLDYAAAVETTATGRIERMLDPIDGYKGCGIGTLPGISDFYGELRRIDHIQVVRDVLLEGHYFDHNARRVVALDAHNAYPYAVPLSGNHVIRI